MKTSSPPATVRTLRAENAELRARLAEAEDTLRAIRTGDVDALVVEGDDGLQIFTLQGLDAEQNRSRGEMLAQVSDSVIAVDNEDHITFLNAAAERQYGIRADEVVGRKLDSVITRQWPSPEAEAEMWTAMGERGEWRGEMIHRTLDGRELHIESSSAALRGSDGERVGVVRTIRDVSERKQAEEALRHSERRFRGIFDSALQFIGLMTPDGTVLEANRTALKAGGLRAENVIGKPFWECDWWTLTERTGRELRAAIGRAASGELVRYDVDVRGAEGQVITIDFSIKPIRDEAGRVVLLIPEGRDITCLKRAEQALEQSRERILMASEAAQLGFWSWQPDEDSVVWENEYPYRIIGVPPGSAPVNAARFVAEFLHPDDAPLFEQAVARAVEAGEPFAFKGRILRPDGGERWVEFTGKAAVAENGRVPRITGTVQDITERKLAEKALAERTELLHDVLEAATDLIFVLDLSFRVMLVNAACAKVFGVPPGQLVGKTAAELFPPDMAAAMRQQEEAVIAGGSPIEVEHDFVVAGVARIFLILKTPLRDGSGRVIGILGITRDITVRKQFESALWKSEAKLREQLAWLALLEQITRAINNRLDFQHILKVVTDHLEDHLPVDFCCVCLFDEQTGNYEVAQVGTKSTPLAIEMAMPEHTVISLDCDALAQAARGELSYLPDVREIAFPFPQRLAKGGLGSLVLAPLQQEESVIGFLLVARRAAHSFADGECEFLQQLSEHVALSCRQARLHDALQTAHDDLRLTQQSTMQRERLRALGQMACGITHDISNAISPVTLYTASLLEHEKDLSVRARNSLQTIHQAVNNVTETINRMREFCRQGESQIVLSPIHLNHVAQQALDLTRVHWSESPHERGIVIQTEIQLAEDLPDIMGVESEIRDAIVNLILNAVDAMPGGGTLTLRTVNQMTAGTGGAPDARQVCFELMDTGIGMDEDTRRRCLEPFFTTKGEHGSGMGLAMVYGMISRHHAGIDIQSTPGEGTSVRILFPVIDSASKGVDRPLQTNPEPANQRILFIDDDPLLIKSMRDTLEADGHTVVTAAGGLEGIHAFVHAQESDKDFTVVITDLGMPHVDGRKVARAVKAASPSTPVILLTGWGQRLDAEGEIRAQVDWLLSKPPNPRELREALAACCPLDLFKPKET